MFVAFDADAPPPAAPAPSGAPTVPLWAIAPCDGGDWASACAVDTFPPSTARAIPTFVRDTIAARRMATSKHEAMAFATFPLIIDDSSSSCIECKRAP